MFFLLQNSNSADKDNFTLILFVSSARIRFTNLLHFGLTKVDINLWDDR